jgi:TatD DNase family protein
MHLVDTHTHLYSDQFKEDREEMFKRAQENGISHFFLPNIDAGSIKGMNELVAKYPKSCYPMMGLHPCSVKENVEEELKLMKNELDSSTSYVAVGEIGIDLYWDKTFLKQQEYAFRKQIEWAKEKGLPIVIHCREAFQEILQILDEVNDNRLTGIFHCFTGNEEQARNILAYGGFKLGIGGVITFKNAGLDKVVKTLSLNDLVLETDAPYLAPAPYRGKRNESAYLLLVAEKLAELFEVSMEEVQQITSQNAFSIFKINE